MIRRVWFREFRALRDVEVPLERLTVLVGANSVGKTSVLEGIWVLLECIQVDPHDLFKRRWALDRARSAPGDAPTIVGVEQEGGGQINVQTRVGSTQQGATPVVSSVRLKYGVQEAAVEDPLGAHLHRVEEPFRSWLKELPRAFHLRMESPKLSAPSYSESEIPTLAQDGTGLASVIADLAGRAPSSIEALVERVRSVVPQLRGIRAVRALVEQTEWDVVTINDQSVRTQRTQRLWGHRVVVDMQSGADIALSEAGEGTALVIGLMTFVLTHPGVGVLLIDDIDRALHPKAQRALLEALRGVLKAFPSLQIVATSHSPYLVDALEPREVVVLGTNAEGKVLAKRLDTFPDERLRSMLSTGELWMSEGEGWVVQ